MGEITVTVKMPQLLAEELRQELSTHTNTGDSALEQFLEWVYTELEDKL